MEFIIKIGQFLLSLSLLIVLHELGHFIPAKAFKTRVEKFYLFFDVKFSLFKKKIGETVYGIGWLPLGGYVKISGMIDESMDTEAMAKPPQPWEFRSKPAWQRLIIMLGGVFVNFVLALVIYIFMAYVYTQESIQVSSVKGGFLVENPVLLESGFKTGDTYVAFDGVKADKVSDVSKIIGAETVTINRDGVEKVITLPVDFLGQLSSIKNENYGLFKLRRPYIIEKVPDTSHNRTVDLKYNDAIQSINGKPMSYFDEIDPVIAASKGDSITVGILRGTETLERKLFVDKEGKLEVVRLVAAEEFEKRGYFKIDRTDYTFSESFGVGASKFSSVMVSYFGQLKAIFNPSTGAYKGLGGFKAIYDQFSPKWSWEAFWGLTAFLSIMLGVLNLLPIPALDGGHVMFLLYEMVTGRKPGDKFMEYAQVTGFFILIALVLFANGNDIYKAIMEWLGSK